MLARLVACWHVDMNIECHQDNVSDNIYCCCDSGVVADEEEVVLPEEDWERFGMTLQNGKYITTADN